MAKMDGIFVNENGCIKYAQLIVDGIKTIETRNRNMLKCLVGKRVAIVRTKRGKLPMVVGYADIYDSYFCPSSNYEKYRDQTLVPEGSAYDVRGKGKWLYFLTNAEKCDPFPLPQDAVRHGLSWCEYDDYNYMICTSSVYVQKYDPMTDEYEDYWGPSYEDEEEIGWKELTREDIEQEKKNYEEGK